MSTPQEITDQTVATSLVGTDYIVGIDRSDTTQGDDGSICLITRDNLALGISITESQISDLQSYALASHNHAAGDINSGTLADARIAESNVTQHQAAISITESQISDLGSYAPLSGATFTGAVAMPSNGLTVGTDQLVVSGGNVGIGRSSPGTNLEVYNSSSQPLLSMYNGTNWMVFRGDSGTIGVKSGMTIYFSDYSTYPTSGVSDRAAIHPDGQMTINGTSSLATHTIYGHSTSDQTQCIRAAASTGASQEVQRVETSAGGLLFGVEHGGTVAFGAHTAIGAETVTGYITIKDAGGTTRKLAVVS